MMRRLRPDRNPLRRTADRVEAAVMAGLLVMFLAAVPLAALAAAGQSAACAPSGPRHAGTGSRPPSCRRTRRSPPTRCPGRPWSPWCGRGGQRLAGRRARARSTRPAAPGPATTVMVWTGRSGRLEGAPVQRADVTVLEALAALAAAAAVAASGFPARRALDRRWLAGWDAG